MENDYENEQIKDFKSNCFWAGFLIDLPKDDSWRVANEIIGAIEFCEKQAKNKIKRTDLELFFQWFLKQNIKKFDPKNIVNSVVNEYLKQTDLR